MIGSTALPAWSKPVKAVVLTQQNDLYGAVESTISSGAIKIAMSGRRIYLVAKAPEWRVTLFNDESKKAFSLDLQNWYLHDAQLNYMGGDWNRFGIDCSPLPGGRFLGLPCDNYTFPAAIKNSPEPSKSGKRYRGFYTVLKPDAGGVDMRVGPACSIVQKALSCPRMPGIPVAFTAQSAKTAVKGYVLHLGGETHWLSTSRLEVKSVDDKIFTYPVGYAPCSREVEVLKDDKHDASVKVMFKELLD